MSSFLVARRALLVRSRAIAASTSPMTAMHLQSRPMSSSPRDSDLQVQQCESLADESILQHIVCPISKFPLRYDAEKGSLICDEINVAYPIRYGVPMLVPSEARIINQEHGE